MVVDHNSHGNRASTVLYPTADWSTVYSNSNNSFIIHTASNKKLLPNRRLFEGYMNSLEWSGGMEYWSGVLDWTTGVGMAIFLSMHATN